MIPCIGKHSKGEDHDGEDLPNTGFLPVLNRNQEMVMTAEDGVEQPPLSLHHLDSILKEREEDIRAVKKIVMLEEELLEMKVGDSTVLEDNSLSLSKYASIKTIKTFHPGLNIFDKSRFFQLYFIAKLEVPEGNGKFEKLLKVYASSDCGLMNMIFLKNYPRKLRGSPWLLKWLFHLMASTQSSLVLDHCFQIFHNLLLYCKKQSIAYSLWYPSIQDITAVLYNCGADLTQFLLEQSSFNITKETLEDMKLGEKLSCRDKQVIEQVDLLSQNMTQVIRTLFLYLDCSCCRYKDDELSALLELLCVLALDKNFCISLIQIELENVISRLISRITKPFWEFKVEQIADIVIKVANHHHNVVYLAEIMPLTAHEIEFQKVFSLVAIMKLTNTEIPIDAHNLKPSSLVDLFKQRPLYKITDLYLLNSIVHLIDIYIGDDPSASSRKTIQEIVILLKQAAGKIKENFNCVDTTKVKDLMIRIASKLTIQTQNMPTSNRKLFDYVQVQSVLEDTENAPMMIGV